MAGGDGTLHHAVNALGDRPVAIVPVPTRHGNDFSRGLGVGADLSAIATTLASLETRRIDLIEVNGHRVCTVAGAGIVADAGLQVGRLLAPGSSASGRSSGGLAVQPICSAAPPGSRSHGGS